MMRLDGDGDGHGHSWLWWGEFKKESKLAKKIANKIMKAVK